MTPGYTEFEFDLPEALLASLIVVLDGMETAVLNAVNTAGVAEQQGVYQLFYKGELVYIGKTDSEAGLYQRLTRHTKRLLHRPLLDAGSVEFKAVRIMVFTAMDLETSLIKHYGKQEGRGKKRKVPWNDSGFGSNDPGRKREETNKPPDGFDGQYPISIDRLGPFVPEGAMQVSRAVTLLKKALPYTFRFQTLTNERGHGIAGTFHADLPAHNVTIPPGPLSARQTLEVIVAALPTDWQATRFDSHVILYKESKKYTHGTIIKQN